jgi:hypothetical protein
MLPKPWPQIVKRDSDASGDEAVVSAGDVWVPDLVAQALADDIGPEDDASIAVARVSAEETEPSEQESASETDPVVVPEVDLEPIEPEAEDTLQEKQPATDAAEPELETAADILPPPTRPASQVPVGPVSRETPGWRPRSQP